MIRLSRPLLPLLRSADFERVLRRRSYVSSSHFALHHLAASPQASPRPCRADAGGELSTGLGRPLRVPVDECPGAGSVWWGAVVPKRHARRAVTRTLLKRQIRAAVATAGSALPSGLWVVRLRAPFDRSAFRSAASEALKRSARVELDQLMTAASQRPFLVTTPDRGCPA